MKPLNDNQIGQNACAALGSMFPLPVGTALA